MNLIEHVGFLSLRQVLAGACKAVGMSAASEGVDMLGDFLVRRFTDQSGRLQAALQTASARAWKALEVALAGESFWNWLDAKEDRELRAQVRAFLDAVPAEQLPREQDIFRRHCLDELRAAQRTGLLSGKPDPQRLARECAQLTRFGDPRSQLQAEEQVVRGLAEVLAGHGHVHLAHLLALPPPGGESLLALAARYYFRRAVEEDQQLFQGLTWASWEGLAQSQEKGFAQLGDVLAQHGQELEQRLDGLRTHLAQIHGAVLDIREEQRRQGHQHHELYEAVLAVHRRLEDLGAQPAHKPDSRTEEERRLLDSVLAGYRALPGEQQQQLPALLDAVGRLLLQVGEADEARKTFAVVAGVVTDRLALAESHYHAYQRWLERRSLARALASYRKAAELAPGRYTEQRLESDFGDVLPLLPPQARADAERALAEWRLEKGTRNIQ